MLSVEQYLAALQSCKRGRWDGSGLILSPTGLIPRASIETGYIVRPKRGRWAVVPDYVLADIHALRRLALRSTRRRLAAFCVVDLEE